MAAFVKKEPNSDLYESDQSRSNPSTYHTLNYSQESNSRNLDRARWSEHDMEILFSWFQDPQNLASYTTGVKAKAMRAMAEIIPGKTDRQVLNKMTALENHYHQCKTRLKQGIPLTERDLECGIDSAQAKVKSIFRYYYEMDQILGSQSQTTTTDTGYNPQSRLEEQTDYDSPRAIAPNGTQPTQQISHHSIGERISPSIAPTSNRPSFPASGGYTPEAYPQETFSHESFSQPKYATQGVASNSTRRNPMDGSSDALPSLSLIRSEGHIYPQREAENPSASSRREPSDSYLTLAPLNSRHGNSRGTEPESNERNSKALNGAARERRLRLAEEKLAFKRAKHQEVMSLAYRQLEAEEEARKISERQHQELLDMRKKEYQMRAEELALEKFRLGKSPEVTDRKEPQIIISSANEGEADPAFNNDTTHSNPLSFPEVGSETMEDGHPRIQTPTNP
ncbi:hypothetical protein DSO57_1034703 [Entomophthora muscae]|uniref:Uncharacterized protein n=1 Tax=Entomophthora muscae TaxID=34485 RepID=A0ACC2SP18_9FUNG|nr:hypothetical protein DSO57_1034703 [Entomophthora muscae]